MAGGPSYTCGTGHMSYKAAGTLISPSARWMDVWSLFLWWKNQLIKLTSNILSSNRKNLPVAYMELTAIRDWQDQYNNQLNKHKSLDSFTQGSWSDNWLLIAGGRPVCKSMCQFSPGYLVLLQKTRTLICWVPASQLSIAIAPCWLLLLQISTEGKQIIWYQPTVARNPIMTGSLLECTSRFTCNGWPLTLGKLENS